MIRRDVQERKKPPKIQGCKTKTPSLRRHSLCSYQYRKKTKLCRMNNARLATLPKRIEAQRIEKKKQKKRQGEKRSAWERKRNKKAGGYLNKRFMQMMKRKFQAMTGRRGAIGIAFGSEVISRFDMSRSLPSNFLSLGCPVAETRTG